ncbi:MAG: GNAT family N-acetyltransferase [Segetibacter sp.]
MPEFQGRGIGSSILKELLDKAQSEQKRLELEVLRVNADAQRLYKRLGFVMEEKDDQKYFMYKDVSP